MHQNSFSARWGAFDAPDSVVGWGGGHPPLHTHPFDAFGVSISVTSAPRLSGPAQNKFLATPMHGSTDKA